MSDSPTVVWLDDRIVDDDSGVSVFDRGLTLGLGVFESIELREGVPFALGRHLDRLSSGAAAVGMDLPEQSRLTTAALSVATLWGTDPGRLRITFTSGTDPASAARGSGGRRGPTLLVTASPMQVRTQPARVAFVEARRNEHGALVGVKSTSFAENVAALDRARRSGAEEALLCNTAGKLCEGSMSNVFVELADRLVTPPLSSGCLPGITRAILIEELQRASVPVDEADLDASDVVDAIGAFLVSTGRHVQPVSHIGDDRMAGCPGPLTQRAIAVWGRTAGAARGRAALDY